MTEFKKIIDKELEYMTFNEVKNRRSTKMRKNINFSVKRAMAAAAAVIAAAMALAISASALGLWSLSDFIDRVFPDRNGGIEPYAFSSGVKEGSTNRFNFSVGNFICDCNTLITEFVVTKADGSKFTDTKEDRSFPVNSKLIFPDMSDIDNEDSGSGGVNYSSGVVICNTSDDGLSLTITRVYDCLPRKIKSGDKLQIKICGVTEREFSIDENGEKEVYEVSDEGTVIFNFTVPEIPDPIPLVFKNEKGDKVFDAQLTDLTMSANVESSLFDRKIMKYVPYSFNTYCSPEEAESFFSDSTNPKFYDENMELTDDNVYNGNKYIINDDGSSRRMIPLYGKVRQGHYASMLFIDDPGLEKAKYIEWFGCIAEIPQNE